MFKSINLVLFCFSIFLGYSQEVKKFRVPDSLKGKSYDFFYEKFETTSQDTTKFLIYLNSYLEKSKLENEIIDIARGYCILSFYQKEYDLKFKYLDSSIVISKTLKDKYYPALPYSIKGGHYYNKWNFKKALKNYFLSLEYGKKNYNEYYIYSAKNNISLIKSKLGKYEEALTGFKECIAFKTKEGIEDTISYLATALDISETYTKMNIMDSSSYYTHKGMELSKMMPSDPYHYYYQFVFNEGVNKFYKGDYQSALDDISLSLPFLTKAIDKNYMLKAYLYLGKVSQKLNQNDFEEVYYQKVDSIYQITGNVSFEVREAYNALVRYHKDKGNTKEQLIYIEKLLEFDSILSVDYRELNDILVKEYDTPELLMEKERLVEQANAQNSKKTIYIRVLIFSVLLFIGLFSYQFFRKRLFQKRFEILSRSNDEQQLKDHKPKKKRISAEDIGISTTIVTEVLAKLEDFEIQKGYLSSKITVTQMASTFKTNTKYLSKIINVYKEKSFSQYINDLRIEHAVKRLKEDGKFRKYTIKAIARETGFNTSEAFSKSFYSKCGIYPSFFVKKLEENK